MDAAEAPASVIVCDCGQVSSADAHFCPSCWRSLAGLAPLTPEAAKRLAARRARRGALNRVLQSGWLKAGLLSLAAATLVLYVVGGSALVGEPEGDASALEGLWSTPGGTLRASGAAEGWKDSLRGEVASGLTFGMPVLTITPVGRDSRLAVSADGTVALWRPGTATPVWSRSFEGAVTSGPSVDGEKAYVPVGDKLVALAIQDGRTLWTADVGVVVRGVTVTEDNVYASVRDRGVVALDRLTGQTAWSFEARPLSHPAVYEGVVYVSVAPRRIYMLDAKTGETRAWLEPAQIVRSGIAADAGALFFGDDSGKVYSVSTDLRYRPSRIAGGVRRFWTYLYVAQPVPIPKPPPPPVQTAWTAQLNGAVRWVAVDEASAYAATSKGEIVALDRGTGEVRWRSRTGSDFAEGGVISDKAVYGVQTSGELVALDKATGAVLWRLRLPSPAASRAISDGGGIIVPLRDGTVIRIQ